MAADAIELLTRQEHRLKPELQRLAPAARRVGAIMAFAILAAVVAAHADPPPKTATEPAESAPEVQDILLLGPLEPIRLRLRIEIDGVPFRTVWREAFHRLFDQFDADHDGRLTPEQAGQVAAVFSRGAAPGPSAVKPTVMRAASLTRDDLRARLEQTAPPLTLRQRLSSRGAGPALIPLLDTDGDGRLSREELMAAEQSLHCRDFNDDQLITEQELLAGPSLSSTSSSGESAAGDGSVILVTSALDAAAVAEILLARYDRNRDGALSLRAPAEILSSEGGLAALDIDGDQLLTRSELRGFLDLPLDAELPFALGGGGAGRQRATAAERYRLRKKLDGGYRLHVGASEIDFRRNNRDPSKDDNRPRLRDYDADTNEYLDANEFMNVPDRPDFAVVDSDHDDKISAAEFDAFFLQRARAGAAQLVLEATDQGSDLFTTLDRNFDRVLTPRELHQAPALLATEDRDGDGFLGGAEMSYNLTLDLSRGGPRVLQNAVAGLRGSAEPQVKAERKGPAWFQKMDRNRDGDVSLLEFLGSRRTFEQLDKDHDGLLSPDEAATLEARAK
jgi:Ca2+-binding EF-hand superfamily protein